MKVITVLGCDPGYRNFGFSVVQVARKGDGFVFRVKTCGMLKDTLKDMKGDVIPRIDLFKREIRSLCRKYKVSAITAERFQSRGLRGLSAELVSGMIFLLTQVGQKDVNLITASQWKNQFNRAYGKGSLDEIYKVCRVEPHELDSVCIAIYGACARLGLPHFINMDRNELLRRIHRATNSRLKNRRVLYLSAPK